MDLHEQVWGQVSFSLAQQTISLIGTTVNMSKTKTLVRGKRKTQVRRAGSNAGLATL